MSARPVSDIAGPTSPAGPASPAGPFAHLHCHTHYSLLDGMTKIPELVRATKQAGMNAAAITDHGNLYGAMEFYHACRAEGVNPILGIEAYMAPRSRTERGGRMKESNFHLTLLAQNATGFRNLVRMSSIAYTEGFYYKPRMDKELLKAHSEGLIVLSGCVSGELSRHLLNEQQEEAEDLCKWYVETFGDRFYMEIQDSGIQIQKDAGEATIDLANKMGLPLVATNDSHYLCGEDAVAHDILLCVNTRSQRTDAKRMRLGSQDFYVKSPEEMYQVFPGQREAVERSQEIADRCDIQLEKEPKYYPVFKPPRELTDTQYLREICERAMAERYGDEATQEHRDRLDLELGVIEHMGYSSYFLIVWDFVEFAKREEIPCTARGSAAGAIVAYLLGISDVCPLKYDLLFERFLDKSRKEPPDIDIDFCRDRRQLVIDYTKEKYGEDSVAQIGTFGTLKAKAVVRDVGRALGVPLSRVNEIAKAVPDTLGISLADAVKQSPELGDAYNNDPQITELIDIAYRLEGLARSAGTHAAGVVVADQPLMDLLPLQVITGKEDVITQWDGPTVEAAGLLKMDFLGLRNLTILDKAVRNVKKHRGVDIVPRDLPLDDKPTFALLQRGETKGVFQLESGGMRDLLTKMRPDKFADVIATSALYRPGPLEGGMVMDYVNVKNGRQDPAKVHPIVDEILEETYGVMCLHEDTRVAMADGSERPIRLVRRGDRVHSLNRENGRFEVKDCHGCGPTRRGAGLRLTLGNGFAATLTPDHKVLTYDGMKEAQDLDSEVDLIATGLSLPADPSDAPPLADWLGDDADVAHLLGLLVGDGCLTGKGLSLATGVEAAHERIAARLADRLPSLRQNPYRHGRCWYLGLSHPDLLNQPGHGNRKTRFHAWLEEFGLKTTAEFKRIPAPIFTAAPDVRASFLAGLIDADGCIAQTKKGACVCNLTTVSAGLREDVRRLCQLEGISVSLRPNRVLFWSVRRLAARIGRFLVTKSFRRTGGTLHDGRTVGWAPRSAVRAAVGAGESQRAFAARTGIERSLLRYKHPFVKSPTAQKAGLRFGDVRYFRIASIERVEDQQFYGMSVADHHNLVANGIVVKNCYQEQVMRILNRVGGIELASAYKCIKAISKKKLPIIAQFRDEYIAGAMERGMDVQVAENLFGLIEKFAGYGFNKCVVGETEVLHAETGERTTVGDLFRDRRPFTVHALNERGELRPRRVTDVVWNGRKPTFELRTGQGKRLIATANHPVRTFDGWTNLGDLKPGDRIAAPRRLQVSDGGRMPRHELTVLAGLIAEGNACHPSCLYFYNNRRDLIGDFIDAARQFPDTVARLDVRGDGKRMEVCPSTGRDARFKPGAAPWNAAGGGIAVAAPARSGASRWAQRLGLLGKKAAEKFVPAPAFALCDDDLAFFLGRLWAGDGFVGSADQTPFYATSSGRLATDVQTLLLRLGIVAGVRSKTFRYRYNGVETPREAITVHLVGNDAIAGFVERVLPHALGRETQVAAFREAVAARADGMTSKDTVPAEVRDWVAEERVRAGLTWGQLQERSGVCVKEFVGRGSAGKRGFRRATVAKLAAFFGSDRLAAAAASDLFWDTVVSVEPRGVRDTYDLTVEEDHNFVADGLVVHNSHSTAYGAIAYQTAYLKAHYPPEFMAALLSCGMESSDRITEHVEDARRMGLEVLPPDVNRSDVEFSVVPLHDENGEERAGITFGLGAVKGLGLSAMRALVEEREAHGPYKDLFEITERVDPQYLNRSALDILIKCGALDSLGPNRAQHAAVTDRAVQAAANKARDAAAGQASLFGEEDEADAPEIAASFPDVPDWTRAVKLAGEKEVFGFYLTSHPLTEAGDVITKFATAATRDLGEAEDGVEVTVGGMVGAIKKARTKKPSRNGNSDYVMFDFEDAEGCVRCIMWPEEFARQGEKVEQEAVLYVKGKVDRRGREPNLIVNRLMTPDEAIKEHTRQLAVKFQKGLHAESDLSRVREILGRYPGETDVVVLIDTGSAEALGGSDGEAGATGETAAVRTRYRLSTPGHLRVSCGPGLRRELTEVMGEAHLHFWSPPVRRKTGSPSLN